MFKNIFRLVAVFVVGMVGGIFANQVFWPYFVERPLFLKYHLQDSPVYVTEVKEIFIQENTALKGAIEKVNKTVVGIRSKTKTRVLEGSGLIVTSDGLIVTLDALLPQGSTTTLFFEDEEISPKVLRIKDGLALLKIDKENLPTLAFADYEKVGLGERVFLAGIIFEKEKPEKVINVGVIKYLDTQGIYTNIFEKKTLRGSALFDIQGSILGLNTIDSEGKVITIPVSEIKKFLGF